MYLNVQHKITQNGIEMIIIYLSRAPIASQRANAGGCTGAHNRPTELNWTSRATLRRFDEMLGGPQYL